MSEKIEMIGDPTKVDLDRELVECNARLAECNLKLAEHNCRLAEYHDNEEEETTGEEEETINVNLLKEKYLRSFIGIMTIGGVMFACGTGILGYFGGNVITIKDIRTLDEIVVMGYCVWLSMSK